MEKSVVYMEDPSKKKQYLEMADVISTSVDPNDLYGNDDSDGTPGELP